MADDISRYAGLEPRLAARADGQAVLYTPLRLCPLPQAATGQVTVQAGDRLDLLAARVLGDPRLAWRLADANSAMDPWDLTRTPGRTLHTSVD